MMWTWLHGILLENWWGRVERSSCDAGECGGDIENLIRMEGKNYENSKGTLSLCLPLFLRVEATPWHFHPRVVMYSHWKHVASETSCHFNHIFDFLDLPSGRMLKQKMSHPLTESCFHPQPVRPWWFLWPDNISLRNVLKNSSEEFCFAFFYFPAYFMDLLTFMSTPCEMNC